MKEKRALPSSWISTKCRWKGEIENHHSKCPSNICCRQDSPMDAKIRGQMFEKELQSQNTSPKILINYKGK